MKKALSLFMSIVMLVSITAGLDLTANAEVLTGNCGAEGDGSNVSYTLDTETGVLTISGNGEMDHYVNGKNPPWKNNKLSIDSVVINSGVTGIGACAFAYCQYLEKVTMPNTVTSIGINAFHSCYNLTNITLSNNLKVLNDGLFYCCSSLRNISIPYSVISIQENVFDNCNNLKTITILNKDCIILDSYSTIYSTSKIIGYVDSTAQLYAQKYSRTFIDITKTEHNYSTEIFEPNCTQIGYIVYICDDCGYSYTDDIKALEHNYSAVVTEPTCTENGYTTYICSRCKDLYVDNYIDALGHSFTNYKNDNNSNCTKDGTKTAKCDRCDLTKTVIDVGSASGHNYGAVVTPPNCTAKGYTTHTCTVCGDSYVDSYTNSVGHIFNGGKNCVVCGAVNPNYVDATPTPTPTPTQPTTTAPAQPTTQPQQEATTQKEATTKPASVKVGKTVYKADKNGDYVSTKVKKPAVSKATNAKKSIEITWKKVDAVSGYEVEYSTDKKFKKSVKTATVKGNKAKNPSVTIKNLKSNKTYYVRIRTYKTTKVNGEKIKVYSSWSKVKTVKTK